LGVSCANELSQFDVLFIEKDEFPLWNPPTPDQDLNDYFCG